MFRRLGLGLACHPRLTLVAWICLIVMAIAFAFTPLFGKPLFSLLESGLPSIPNTDSRRVADYLGEEEDQAETIFLVVTNTPIPKADSPADSALVKLREDIERVDADIEILDAPTFAHAIDEIDTAIADGKAEVDAQLRQAREEALAQLEAQFAPAQAQIDQLVQRDPARALAAQAQLDAEKAAASAKVEAQLAEASTRAEAELEAELAEVRAQRSDAAQALSRFTPTESEGYVLLAQLPSDRPENETEQIHRDVVTLMQRAGTDIAGAENATVFSQPLLLDSMIEQVQADLVTGEAVGVPIALILMVLIFGGLIAAGLPLAGAITSIVIGLGGLWVLTSFTAVDSFIVNVISIIGLGLSIDYGLLVVSRYREEVQNRLESAGFDPFGADLPRHLKASERSKIHAVIAEAIAATVATSGRTVFFSGLTIACSLAGLLAMQASLLRVIAVAGLFVVLLAVATAVTLVPALISLLGTILLRPSILTRIPVLARVNDKLSDRSSERGVFSAIARFVHRRPWPILLVVVAILGILAAPISQMNLRFYIGDNLPQGTQVREAYLTLHDEYVALTGADMQILADAPLATVEESGYVRDLRNRYGSDAVVVSAREGESQSLINVRTGFADPVSHDAIDQMLDQRAHQADFDTWVGGAAGLNYDFNEQLADGFPFALSVVIAAVFILMFMMTGSLLVPLKAAIINAFSLIASLGATVWIFQGGHFGMEQVPGLEAYVVAMVLAFGFGLAMDYEVFLLARIKEYWDGGAANDHAVELGLQKSGRIITSAAVIIIAVFFGFVFGDMRAIKQTGIALAMTVAVDATLVRMLLVPATMTLLGQWNWWAPKPLARLYTRFGISEG